jgi:transglutaminase-like putative cysteine protease
VSRGLIERVRNANRTRRSEESVRLRAAVLCTVVASCAAATLAGVVSIALGLTLLALLPAAYYVSYRRRNRDNFLIKAVLAIAAVWALVATVQEMAGVATLDEVRFPLAKLFLIVQVLHSFDLPQRKDLHFSMASSLALLAVAGSISQDLWFGAVLLVYFPCALVALMSAHRSEVAERAARAPSRLTDTLPIREGARAGAAVLAVAAVLFLLVPRSSAARALSMPFSLGGSGVPAAGGIVNPGFPDEAATRASASSFHAFAPRMDLRVRGDLPDDLVMRIRASSPAMWKGMTFDRYDGATWHGDSSEASPLAGDPPYAYPSAFRSLGPRASVMQTFYIEREQPNVVFAAGQPDSVWIEGGVAIDRLGGLRTPSTLTPGAVYSVVSTRGSAGPALLRAATGPVPESVRRYLQLPSELPTRIGDLARRVTAGATNDLERVIAVEDYLRTNYRYATDSPVPPPDRDAVDHFLFDARVGFCEQFASATAVMLRTLGIPARVVAGYAVGDHNPLTGLYEVRASDAHSWVEVWFPEGLGWYEFDPTFDVPPARSELGDVVPLVGLLRAAAGGLRELSREAPVPAPAGLAGLALLSALAWNSARARRRRGERGRRGSGDGFGEVTRALALLERALARHGRPRAPQETARELFERAGLTHPAATEALAAFEEERYGAGPPPVERARRAAHELTRLAGRVERGP